MASDNLVLLRALQLELAFEQRRRLREMAQETHNILDEIIVELVTTKGRVNSNDISNYCEQLRNQLHAIRLLERRNNR